MRNSLIGNDSPLDRLRARTREALSGTDQSKTTKNQPAIKPLSDREERLLAEILAKPMDYIDSEEFRRKRAEKTIYDLDEVQKPDVSWYRPLMDDILPSRSRNVNAKTGKTLVLTGEQERILFLKFN